MYIQQEKKVELCKKNMLNLIRESQVGVVSTEVRPRLSNSRLSLVGEPRTSFSQSFWCSPWHIHDTSFTIHLCTKTGMKNEKKIYMEDLHSNMYIASWNRVWNALSCCLTELFPIYQNKHWTIRRRNDRSVDPSSHRIILKIVELYIIIATCLYFHLFLHNICLQ